MNKKQLIRATAFLLLLALTFVPVNRVLSRSFVDHNFHRVAGFYEEPEESLDAIYIGSSNTFTFWNPLFGWDEFGITVYNFGADGLPFEATAYLIEEARKTQPDALFLVNLNSLNKGIDLGMTHQLVDHMPMSFNRIALIEALSAAAGWSSDERMALHFPISQFHSRWTELVMHDFSTHSNGLKVGITYGPYFGTTMDLSAIYHTSDTQLLPTEQMMTRLNDLLAYCDENQVNILFLTIPHAKENETIVSQLNYAEAYIREQGYPVLSLLNDPAALGLDLTTDFYNEGHTNIHGSLKFTRYVGRYLVDNYGFTDKRGEEAYASWDQARSRYDKYILPHTLDIEFSGENRDFSLPYPKNAAAVLSDDTVNLSWDPSEGAEGYRVYRRLGKDAWELLAEVTAPACTDAWAGEEMTPQYRIVPFRLDQNGTPLFGSFLPQGVSVVSE